MGQDGTCEALISINHQLDLPEAAAGILYCAQNFHHIELKESWYEKLKRWETALQIYESKQVLRIGRDEDWDGFFWCLLLGRRAIECRLHDGQNALLECYGWVGSACTTCPKNVDDHRNRYQLRVTFMEDLKLISCVLIAQTYQLRGRWHHWQPTQLGALASGRIWNPMLSSFLQKLSMANFIALCLRFTKTILQPARYTCKLYTGHLLSSPALLSWPRHISIGLENCSTPNFEPWLEKAIHEHIKWYCICPKMFCFSAYPWSFFFFGRWSAHSSSQRWKSL